MSVPAPPRPLQPFNGMGVLSFALGLMVTFGLIVYATWLAVAAVTAVSTTNGAANGAAGQRGSLDPGIGDHGGIGAGTGDHGTIQHGAGQGITPTPPVAAPPWTPTPSGATMAFDQLWTGGDGNTIVVGSPTVLTSPREGQVIQVAVTLTNNSERTWHPESATFIGKLNDAPAPQAAEGDWRYEVPIVGHTSVTLTKVFVGGPGQFDLTVHTPEGVAVFTGWV